MSRKLRPPPQLESLEGRLVQSVIGSVVAPPVSSGAVLQPLPTPTTTPTTIPALSSNPGAAVKLYLDFDGHYEPNWPTGPATANPFNLDLGSDPSTFSEAERGAIREIHARVSEDFAPFNIDVTTVDPGDFSNGRALRVAIGDGGPWQGVGGKGGVNSFTNDIPNVSWVFHGNQAPAPSPKTLAEVASHEAGHGFGLAHQAAYDANGAYLQEYNNNGGSKLTAPIMGNSYGAFYSRWWRGPTTSSTTIQDDMAVIARAANGFGYRADDHIATPATATWLNAASNGIQAAGIIERQGDTDWFAFWSDGGYAQLQWTGPTGSNLEARLEFRDARRQLIPMTKTLGSTYYGTLPRGMIFMVVRSADGSYGNVGQYRVEGTVPSAGPAYQATGPRVLPTDLMVESNTSEFVLRLAFDKPMAVASLNAASFRLLAPSGSILRPYSVTMIPGKHGGRYFEIRMRLSEVGSYRLEMLPGVTDVFGNRLDQDGDGIQGDTLRMTILRKGPTQDDATNV